MVQNGLNKTKNDTKLAENDQNWPNVKKGYKITQQFTKNDKELNKKWPNWQMATKMT